MLSRTAKLKISLRFKEVWTTIVRILLLAELKNAFLRKKRLKVSAYLFSEALDASGCNFKNKIFLDVRPFTLFINSNF